MAMKSLPIYHRSEWKPEFATQYCVRWKWERTREIERICHCRKVITTHILHRRLRLADPHNNTQNYARHVLVESSFFVVELHAQTSEGENGRGYGDRTKFEEYVRRCNRNERTNRGGGRADIVRGRKCLAMRCACLVSARKNASAFEQKVMWKMAVSTL